MIAFNSKVIKFPRLLYITSRSYSEKAFRELEEEALTKKPREVHGQPYPDWRKPWIEREGEWKSKLSLFIEKNPNPDIITAMSKVPDLTTQQIKSWWRNMKDLQEIENQKYLPKRVAILGANLGAVHFFTHRSCTVRIKDSTDWIKGDIMTLNLPVQYEDGWYVEAVDCSGFHRKGIRYEGIENLRGLNFLKWLSLKNNRFVDIWCFDRLAGQNGHTLEYLDISGCNLCVNSIIALAKMSALKFLIVTDPGDNLELHTALSLLEDHNPKLLIKAVEKEVVNSSQLVNS